MSDTIRSWECPECGLKSGGAVDAPDHGAICSTPPVERTYVAVDALPFLSNVSLNELDAVMAVARRDGVISPGDADHLAMNLRRLSRAAITAVTGEQT